MDQPSSNYYDAIYDRERLAGSSVQGAAELAAEAYLDGKPQTRGKHKLSGAERSRTYWSSAHLKSVPADSWRARVMTLALARYLGQDRHQCHFEDLERVAAVPGLLRKAAKLSGIVMQPDSIRRKELQALAPRFPEIAELCRILAIFDVAHGLRRIEVQRWQGILDALTIIDLMQYASMYAFEHLVPKAFENGGRQWQESPDERKRMELQWNAIADIFHWKLGQTSSERLKMTESSILEALEAHLLPFVYPSRSRMPAREDLRDAFAELVSYQLELNEFVFRSADAFSFDESIDFIRQGTNLEIVEVNADARSKWDRDGRKLETLHGYWFYRAWAAFLSSDVANKTIGRPENHEPNRLAYIRASRTTLRLNEAYGLGETVIADSGEQVDLFQAMLSLELMSAYYQRDFLLAYCNLLDDGGDWAKALNGLAMEGLMAGLENRLPMTWSLRDAKIARIVGWTVTPEFPKGSERMAGAILDFWTTDWVELAARLRQNPDHQAPELLERPVLKLGRYLFQLPWHLGLQNNSTAAINNLRRIGARRGEAKEETRRLESNLARQFESRGFRVVLNWNPPTDDPANAGEVDLICARDGRVLVVEVKSTYIRRSKRDAWMHATTTLRRAGRQVQRKVAAVRRALAGSSDLASLLDLTAAEGPITAIGWIVDTSIERDHEYFSGYLKVSLEEILIALRDDHWLLNDPAQLHGRANGSVPGNGSIDAAPRVTLYPDGFDFQRFVEVIESEAVWSECLANGFAG
jgi:hypothetical protein